LIGFKENRVYRLVNIFYFELRNHDQPFPHEQYNRETLGRLERRFSPRALSIDRGDSRATEVPDLTYWIHYPGLI
jgi:hypothetical protein